MREPITFPKDFEYLGDVLHMPIGWRGWIAFWAIYQDNKHRMFVSSRATPQDRRDETYCVLIERTQDGVLVSRRWLPNVQGGTIDPARVLPVVGWIDERL